MTTPPELQPQAQPEPAWRRLDRRMLFVAPVQELLRGIIPLAALVVTGFGDPIRNAISALGAVLLIGYGVMRYFTTTYRVTSEQVQIRRGLLNRSTSVAPLDRVRSIDVTSPFLHRLFGLGKVVLGTGRTDGKRDKDLVLDSLGRADAERLRGELLHRATRSSPASPTRDQGNNRAERGSFLDHEGREGAARAQDRDRELVRLSYRWLGFAPFTLSGVVTAAVVVGVASRLLNDTRVDPTRLRIVRDLIRSLQQAPVWLDVLSVLAAVLVLVTLLSVLGYLLAFAGFRLTRRDDGTLHVTRGLLTRRETTLEHRRVRGVELTDTPLLRLVRGARLGAIATGLREDRGNERTASVLVPPAPRAVAERVGAAVVDDSAALTAELTAHGAAATRRRWTRALLPTAAVVVVVAVLALTGVLPGWVAAASLVLLPFAALVGADRARALGHRLGDGRNGLVVTRHGSLLRRRAVLATDGVIGATFRASPFQRRQGVVTLELTTAAGRQAYPFTDVTAERAWEIAREVLPGISPSR